MSATFNERFVPTQTVANLERAAHYTGQADAMVTNLCLPGSNSQHSAAWAAEQAAWQRRQNEIVEQAPLGATQLAMHAREITDASYELTVVRQPSINK